MFELTEVMRQRGDSLLKDLLNNVRTGNLNSQNINMIRSRIIQPVSANLYNEAMLASIDNPIYYNKSN